MRGAIANDLEQYWGDMRGLDKRERRGGQGSGGGGRVVGGWWRTVEVEGLW
jgi:hypothetical protein